MARSFTAASLQYLSIGTAPVTAAPFTANIWIYPTNFSAERSFLTIGNSGGNQSWYMFHQATTGQLRAYVNDGGFTLFTSGENYLTAGAWNMCTLVTSSATSRQLFLNGSAGPEDTVNRTPTVNQFGLGARHRLATNQYFEGRLAECEIWNVALTSAEIAARYNSGVHTPPNTVRPDGLIDYYPLYNDDNDIDLVGGLDLTANNAPTYAEHPPLTMWMPQSWTFQSGPPAIFEPTGTGTFTEAADGNIVVEALQPTATGTFTEDAGGDVQTSAVILEPSATGTFTENSGGDVIAIAIGVGTGTFAESADGNVAVATILEPTGTGTFAENANGSVTEAGILAPAGTGLFSESADGAIAAALVLEPIGTGTFNEAADGTVIVQLAAIGTGTFTENVDGGIFTAPLNAMARRICPVICENRNCDV